MRRLLLAVALVLPLAQSAAAATLPLYRDPLGTPGILSQFDPAPGGPIVAVFDPVPHPAATSLLLPEQSAPDPIRLATACQLSGCNDGVPFELAGLPVAIDPGTSALTTR